MLPTSSYLIYNHACELGLNQAESTEECVDDGMNVSIGSGEFENASLGPGAGLGAGVLASSLVLGTPITNGGGLGLNGGVGDATPMGGLSGTMSGVVGDLPVGTSDGTLVTSVASVNSVTGSGSFRSKSSLELSPVLISSSRGVLDNSMAIFDFCFSFSADTRVASSAAAAFAAIDAAFAAIDARVSEAEMASAMHPQL